MDLDALRVRNYRCIDDSGWVSVDELTCLIGKNESGKTAFMEAVEKLNPSLPTGEYDPYRDYPRRDWADYKSRHEEDPDVVASARLSIGEDERERVRDEFGTDLLDGEVVVVHRDYANELRWEVPIDDSAVRSYLLESYEFDEDVRSSLEELDAIGDLSEDSETLATLESELGKPPQPAVAEEIGERVLKETLPEFRLVGEYSILDSRIDVDDVLERKEAGELSPGDQTFLSLLSVAGLDLESFREVEDWHEKTTELETASARISEEAMSYWSQSGDLQIRIQEATDAEGRALELRVENREHSIGVGFDQRSRGFRYFFSSFCQLSEIRERESDLVLMLDEPGLNLHARAKQEFLEFMKTELATRHPIVYTTHSPFMIDPENLHRTKMVMADPIGETNLFTDIALADEPTQFPLRNVFELDLMETLLVNPQTLLVEQQADHIYLTVLSKFLRENDQSGLDSRWTVVPIKDSENIASFIALFGGDRLDVAALLSEDPGSRGSRRRTDREASVEEQIPTKIVSTYSDPDDGTIEDVLSVSFYLTLVNRSYSTAIEAASGVPAQLDSADLPGGSGTPIVERIESYFDEHGINDGNFERRKPALHLQRNREEFAELIDDRSRRNFDRIFRDLNNTLESFEGVDSRDGSILAALGFR